MNLSFYIAKRLSTQSRFSLSGKIVKLAIAGIALGFAIIVLSLSTVNGFQEQIEKKIIGFSGDIEIRKTGSAANYDYPLFEVDSQVLMGIAKQKEVNFINLTATKPGIIKANDEMLGIVFKGMDSLNNFDFFAQYLRKGTIPQKSDEVIISQFMASKLELDTGSKLRVFFIKQPIRAIAVTVAGIYQTGLEEYDKMWVVGSASPIQRIFADNKNSFTHLEIFLKTKTAKSPLVEELYHLLDYDLDIQTAEELHPQLFQWLSYLNVNKYIILTLMLFIAGISLVTALFILVIERTKMIGVLKTMGARTSFIKRIFLIKLSYIAISGMLIGNLLGIGIGFIQLKTGFLKLNQETYYLSEVPVSFDFELLLWINIIGFIVCLLSLLIPVQMISKISPARTVRFE